MNIYRKTIAKLKKTMKSVQDEYDALMENMKQEEQPLLYMDCASEDELLDAYGGGCITRKQLEEGREFFKEASKSKEIDLRDYEGTLKTLKEARLVKSRRNGKHVYYSLDDEHIKVILEMAMEHVEE